jgi:hypothetical protein
MTYVNKRKHGPLPKSVRLVLSILSPLPPPTMRHAILRTSTPPRSLSDASGLLRAFHLSTIGPRTWLGRHRIQCPPNGDMGRSDFLVGRTKLVCLLH